MSNDLRRVNTMRDDADHIIRAIGGMREEGFVDLIDHSTTVSEEENSRLRCQPMVQLL